MCVKVLQVQSVQSLTQVTLKADLIGKAQLLKVLLTFADWRIITHREANSAIPLCQFYAEITPLIDEIKME